jgi:hypothetical protein
VLIFPIFATLVWSLAMVWRRRWPSFAFVTGALLLLLGLVHLLEAWHEHLPSMYRLFYEIMWPYIALTGGVGYFICLLPRPFSGEKICRGCGYDLAGLNPRGLQCPECGMQWRGSGSEFDKPEELVPIPKHPISKDRPTRGRHERDAEVVVIPWPRATEPPEAESESADPR